MNNIRCPHCGEQFQIDETQSGEILKQIRNEEFTQEVEMRVHELTRHMEEKHALSLRAREKEIELKDKEAYEKEVTRLKEKLDKAEDKAQSLQAKLEAAEDKKTIAVMEAVKEAEEEKRNLEK
ncbi:MAG: hypothetical protein J5935_02970, partial [Lachnospiraceae bacterium]|nr:hypothetical protein [Lachnospiraceae bacterium]